MIASHIPLLIAHLLGVLAPLTCASSAQSFCKCICFTNSTIIPLGPHQDAHPIAPPTTNTTSPPSSPLERTTSPPDPNNPDDKRDHAPHLAATTMNDFTPHQFSIAAAAAAPRDNPPSPSSSPPPLARRAPASSSCAQCNRSFCLAYNLPICDGAGEKDVQTMCFQRDSRKDQVIVWGFILGTLGLLVWAAVRNVLERRGREGKMFRWISGGRLGGWTEGGLATPMPMPMGGRGRRSGRGGDEALYDDGGDAVVRGSYAPLDGAGPRLG